MEDKNKQAHEFLHLLKQVYKSEVMKQFNLFAHGEMLVLVHLTHNQSAAQLPSEIGKTTGIKPTRIAAILKTLEKKKYITREIDLTDRRKILVKITDLGVEKALLERDISLNRMVQIFDRMEKEEVESLISTLTKFHETAEKLNFEERKL